MRHEDVKTILNLLHQKNMLQKEFWKLKDLFLQINMPKVILQKDIMEDENVDIAENLAN